MQTKASLAILSYFGWNDIVLLASDNDYGRGIIIALVEYQAFSSQ